MDFKFKKKFGQNFLKDKNLLNQIVGFSQANKNTSVLEIGPGAGALTSEIAKIAGKVVAIEIDTELKPILTQNLMGFDNCNVVYGDFLKMEESEIKKLVGEDYIVVANLPYYITTPILFKFFEMKNKPKSLTIMVQKEYGERMVAVAGTSEYNSLSALSSLLGTAKIVKYVPRSMFVPMPKVDSCVLHFEFNNREFDAVQANFVRNCFSMKRKTLVNNLSHAYNIDKQKLQGICLSVNISPMSRAEEVDVNDLLKIYSALNNHV